MIGTCDFCGNQNRKIKDYCQNGVAIMAGCRYGCDSRRSIPSARNRQRPFTILSIEELERSYDGTRWLVRVKDERDRVKWNYLSRISYETKETLRSAISKECINAKQIKHLHNMRYVPQVETENENQDLFDDEYPDEDIYGWCSGCYKPFEDETEYAYSVPKYTPDGVHKRGMMHFCPTCESAARKKYPY